MDTNAELNARLLNLIDWIGTVGKEIEAGTREQVPELARELIAWGLVESAMLAAIFAVVASGLGCGFIVASRHAKDGKALDLAQSQFDDKRERAKDRAAREALGERPRGSGESHRAADVLQWFALSLCLAAFFFGVIGNARTFVKIKVAPRVYLVETASKWIK